MSEMSRHTPGPWEFEIITSSYVTAFDGTHIADVHHGRTATAKAEGSANARLIAAAPDLLEALKEVFSDHDAVNRLSWVNRAAAAIAKATGGEG